MNECLVIKLKESSTAKNLTSLGALKFNVGIGISDIIIVQIYSHTEQTIKVNSDAYFTNADGSVILPQELTVAAGLIWVYIAISPGITEIEFSNKFGISRLNSESGVNPIWASTTNDFYIHTDFEDFRYCSSLESIFFSLGIGGGNLESLKKIPIKNIFLDPNDNKLIIEGDISHALGQSDFESFVIKNQPLVTGNLSAFSGKNIASVFDLSGTSVTGNIDALSGVSTSHLLLKEMKKFIGGDIGNLNKNVDFFSVTGSLNAVFRFDNLNFNSRTKFLAIQGGFIISGINKLIEKSADLTPPLGTTDYERAINVKANDFNKDDDGVKTALNKLRDISSVKVFINGAHVNP